MSASLQPESKSPSRRALLAGMLGGLGAWAAAAAARLSPVDAAAGSALIIGSTSNSAGTANTALTTSSSGTALLVTQNGSGTALRGSAVGAGSIAGFFTAQNGTGISGVTGSPNRYGVYGGNDGSAGTGAAMRAFGGNNIGLVATSDTNHAITGTSTGSGDGVRGVTSGGIGVLGTSSGFDGVRGVSTNSKGVRGISTNAEGVLGDSTNGTGVYGVGGTYAGYFNGPVYVVGLLTKAGGGFKVDHPLDPAGKYLQHSFVESPDMKNVYDGVVSLDATGEATVELPAYFEALNRDLRYQLTAIGVGAPDLHVKSKLADGRFVIAGGSAGLEVCWQLTGIRHDPFAEAQPIVVEQPKGAAEQGTYLHPELYGQPPSKATHPRPDVAAAGGPAG